MNSILAANFLENPLILAAILLFGALSNWLMKARRPEPVDASTPERAAPSHAERARPARPLDWQETLRQLLGVELPPELPPPPLSRSLHDEHRLPADEESFHRDEMRPAESSDAAEEFRPPERRTVQPSRSSGRAVRPWREPRNVRRAFVASVVFAPPKGWEI